MLDLEDWLRTPKVGRAALTGVWLRNFLYFKQNLLGSFFWIVVEPLLYLLAIGWGVGRYVGEVNGTPYIHYFFPALLATSGMFVAFFESAYGTFTKLTRQKT